ncbi:hypothetical protein ACTOJ1_000037 [Shigella flexneri]
MAFFPKNFIHPEQFKDLPWQEWNCLYTHSLALKLQEIICLVEHMYRCIPTMHGFEIKGRSLSILNQKHPEITPYLSSGNILPVNYLVNIKIKDDKGNYITHPRLNEFNELFNEYGFPLLTKFLGRNFSRIQRRQRYDIYKKISFFLVSFSHVINSWQWGPRLKPEQVRWVRNKDSSMIKDIDVARLPICYASWQHVLSIKNDYDLYIGFMEKMLEAEDLHRQHFLWQIEKCFKDIPDIRRIVLRDPWSELRGSLLSYGKGFHFKVETYKNASSMFIAENILDEWAYTPLISDIINIGKIGINQSVLPLMKKEAVVIEGATLEDRMKGYKKLINNINTLKHRAFDKRFLILLEQV